MAADRRAGEGRAADRAAILQVSTILASIAEVATTGPGGGLYAYRCSKAALNMASASLAVDLRDSGVLVTSLHPGWVQTDMGGPNGHITAETSATVMLETMAQLSDKDHGAFLTFDNKPIQW
jgi:NAD(P)-dependent dehydrogenase (short-subunit alcohol dehydrogenase family)